MWVQSVRRDLGFSTRGREACRRKRDATRAHHSFLSLCVWVWVWVLGVVEGRRETS
jgi:hypothetical protein